MKSIIIRNGLLAGSLVAKLIAISAIFNIGTLDLHHGMKWNILAILISLSFIFIGTKRYVKRTNETVLSFKKALYIGIGISFIASIFYTITWELVYTVFYPDFMEQYTKHLLAELKHTGNTSMHLLRDEQMINDYADNFKKGHFRLSMVFMEMFSLGLLMSFISAFIYKKKI